MPRSARAKPGCHECSQRRIRCDLGTPSCAKCLRKGIECSGQTKYRFNIGVANRGILKGYVYPSCPQPGQEQGNISPVQWKPPGSFVHKRIETASKAIPPDGNRRNTVNDSVELIQSKELLCSPLLTSVPLLPSGVSFLFSHFSLAICPHMVVFDTSNGWRDFILPQAINDDLVQQAVCVTAAQHVVLRRPVDQHRVEEQRLKLLSRLLHEAVSTEPLTSTRIVSTWIALLVLLVGETVTGSPDFQRLTKSLHSFCSATRIATLSGDHDALTTFLMQQTQLFTSLGRPTSTIAADLGFQMGFEDEIEWFTAQPVTDDTEARNLDSISAALRLANILYNTSLGMRPMTASSDMVGELIAMCQTLPSGSQGEHTLVWAYFMGAAESQTEDRREFFVSRMQAIHDRAGFRNISAAIQVLQRLWKHEHSASWACILPQICQVLIM